MEQASAEHKLPLSAGDLVARPHCPICGSPERKHLRDIPYSDTASTHHLRCQACGLVYMDPVPSQDWYDRLYGEEFWEVKSVQQADAEVWSNERQWHKGLARAEKYINLLRQAAPEASIKSVLEIGASFGLIGTAVADAYGARAFGVEPNHAARAFAGRVSGMTMVAETAAGLETWQPDTPVDLAIFSHVLENIIDLQSALRNVHRKLKPRGLLLIETPNVDWQPSMSIYHPHCFSSQALEVVLAECGFRVRRTSRSGRPTSSLMPRYLTVLSESVAAPLPRRAPGGVVGTETVRSRHSMYRKFYKSRFGGLDYKLSWMRFHRTPFIQRGIASLRASLDRLKGKQ